MSQRFLLSALGQLSISCLRCGNSEKEKAIQYELTRRRMVDDKKIPSHGVLWIMEIYLSFIDLERIRVDISVSLQAEISTRGFYDYIKLC